MRKQGKKWLFIILFPFLLSSLMASLALSINNTLCLDKVVKNRENLNVCFTKINHTIDWLAVNTNTLRKAHKNTSYQLHGGLFKIFMVAGIFFSALSVNKSNISSIKSRQTAGIKSTILLKLRI